MLHRQAGVRPRDVDRSFRARASGIQDEYDTGALRSCFEGEARLRAIPAHKFIDGVPVSALGFRASQAIEDGSFGVIQTGQTENSLRSPA